MPIELAPTAWMTRSIVPAFSSQSASVSGMSSPFGVGQHAHELPGLCGLGDHRRPDPQFDDAFGEIELLEDGLRRPGEVGVVGRLLDHLPDLGVENGMSPTISRAAACPSPAASTAVAPPRVASPPE